MAARSQNAQVHQVETNSRQTRHCSASGFVPEPIRAIFCRAGNGCYASRSSTLPKAIFGVELIWISTCIDRTAYQFGKNGGIWTASLFRWRRFASASFAKHKKRQKTKTREGRAGS
jgi:hypothetical protein